MSLAISDVVIAGGPRDFATVRHVRLEGPCVEIGSALAGIAVGDLGCQKVPWSDPVATLSQRSWLMENWPAHAERARGVARALELDHQEHAIDPSFLHYDWAVPGCSNVFWPPATTASGHSILSRNYDFTTGSVFELMGAEAPPEARPATCAPFLLETHPTDGGAYATLSMTSYELLGSSLDGVNEAGLGIALMATVEALRGGGTRPTFRNQVGLNEIQLVRYLLEQAATAAEARHLLERVPQYAQFVPCHYLIADESGDCFLWSQAAGSVRIDGERERPFCATNHIDGHRVADIPEREESVARLETLRAAVKQYAGNAVDERGVEKVAHSVAATHAAGEGQYAAASPARTLWHAYYDLSACSVRLDFYLGDSAAGEIRRSDPVEIALAR